MGRNSSFLQTAPLRASPGAPTHRAGRAGPWDDPCKLSGRDEAAVADAGHRQAGSARPMMLAAVSMDHRTRHWECSRWIQTMPIAGQSSGMTISLVYEPQAPVLDDMLTMSVWRGSWSDRAHMPREHRLSAILVLQRTSRPEQIIDAHEAHMHDTTVHHAT